MENVQSEIAATAARLVVEEGLEYGPAKRRAVKQLGLNARTALPDNDSVEEAVREYIAIFCGDTQPAELAALRRLAATWMERLAEFRPYLGGAVWHGTATRLSDIYIQLFCDDPKSAEIALIDLSRGRSPRLANHIVSWTSLPVGVVSLAERFGGRTVTPDIFAAMVDDVAARLDAFKGRDRIDHLVRHPTFHLLGTSGTVTTLAGVHLELPRYERRRVDGLWMDRDSVDRMVARLLGWDFAARVANPCIGADRADLVLAGCAILEAIRAVWPADRLRVADRGLREGILSELMADEGAWRHRDGGRR